MNNLSSLSQIREKIRAQQGKCPNCGSDLTIEKTKFFETEICESCLDYSKITEINSCCRDADIRMVRFIASNDIVHVRNQCFNCGKLDGKSIGGIPAADRDKLPFVNERLKDARDENYMQERSAHSNEVTRLRQVRFNKDREENNTEWWKKYNAYLQSPAWKNKRELVLKRDNYKCQCCLTGFATQVHHTSYTSVDFKGSEPAWDLTSVCYPCHEKIHSSIS